MTDNYRCKVSPLFRDGSAVNDFLPYFFFPIAFSCFEAEQCVCVCE